MSVWEGGQLISWRWGSLINVVLALLRREDCLRNAWDVQAFGQTDATAIKGMDDAMHSNFFWAYAKLLSLLGGALEMKSQWAEGCRCCVTSPAKSYQARRRAIAQSLQAAVAPAPDLPELPAAATGPDKLPNCRLKGRRAPEYAQGEFTLFAEEIKQVGADQLRECMAALVLSNEEKAWLRADWLSATAACPSRMSNSWNHATKALKRKTSESGVRTTRP